ncbi:BLUF domain-containing protein [Methylobacterium durans]|uniref:BLUF domain-containing protein n=1 Tax=Methylobacterium durans TaxID=2202825 RepID=UPI002AFFBE91|nr:BLUF domain-containing protein [Methylobacterium durans]MEA1834280.1 BLUF domain-containing protein [Methylobacterium durans]
MPIHRLLYRSDVHLLGTEASIRQQIAEIVRASEVRNAAHDLTGALLHTRGVFVQALEGPLPAVEATFERICCDLRHRRVELLEFVHAEARIFGEWSMAGIRADRTIQKLFPCLGGEEESPEPASAQATIGLMRSLLVTGSSDGSAPPKISPVSAS